MTASIKYFIYGTPMKKADYEYTQLLLDLIPEKIMKQYELRKTAVNNKVYFEIQKGIPELK